MKTVVQVKLMPTPQQATALRVTLDVVNDAACWVSTVAFAHGVPREFSLRELTYGRLKDWDWVLRPPSM